MAEQWHEVSKVGMLLQVGGENLGSWRAGEMGISYWNKSLSGRESWMSIERVKFLMSLAYELLRNVKSPGVEVVQEWYIYVCFVHVW